MGYRDDFYKVENLIGYTGNVRKDPTVYFFDGDHFGHITQYHHIPINIGRSRLRRSINYSIRNDGPDRSSVEYNDGKKIHTSRNPFIAKKHISESDLAVLYQSITNYPEMKECGDQVMREQMQNKSDLMREMHRVNVRRGLQHVPPSHMKGSGT